MNSETFREKFNGLTNNKYASFRIRYVNVGLRAALVDNRNIFEKVPVEILFLVPYEVYALLMTDENKEEIKGAVVSLLPPEATVTILYQKSFCTAEDVRDVLVKYIAKYFPLIKTQMTVDCIAVRKNKGVVSVSIVLQPILEGMVRESAFVARVTDELERNFTDRIRVDVSYMEENIVLPDDQPMVPGDLPVDGNVIAFERQNTGSPLFGKYLGDTAHTIRSVQDQNSNYETICGEIKSVKAGVSKKGKRYYIFRLGDRTAEINVKFFARSDKECPLDQLKEGEEVVASGSIVEENDNERFASKQIVRFLKLSALDRCKVNYDSLESERKYRKVPEEYTHVFPESISDPFENEIGDVLNGKTALHPFLEDDWVVVDLETTGLDPQKDYITEIGAVLLHKGIITKQFTTLVKPPVGIPPDVAQLTGITDEMVADAPGIQDVMGDFYKFAAGKKLIAYNAEFDIGFIRRIGKDLRYNFNNRYEDALVMAKVLGNQRPKLEWACSVLSIYYPVKHRALGDAIVTAELVKRLKRKEME